MRGVVTKRIGIASLGLFLGYGGYQQAKVFHQDYQHNNLYRETENTMTQQCGKVKEKLANLTDTRSSSQ